MQNCSDEIKRLKKMLDLEKDDNESLFKNNKYLNENISHLNEDNERIRNQCSELKSEVSKLREELSIEKQKNFKILNTAVDR
jgi:dynactin complex subunit